MEYKLKRLGYKNLSEITTVIDECFGLKTNKKDSLTTWKFFKPHKNDLYAYGAYYSGKLVSFYSDKLQNVTDGSKIYKSTVCIDMCTHPDHRRKGLISKLSKLVYKEVKLDKCDFSFGFSNSHGVIVDKNSKDYGYKVIGQFSSYKKLIIPSLKTRRYLVKEISPSDINAIYSKGYLQILCNSDYLKWRYQDVISNKKYKFFKISHKSKILGWAILEERKMSIGLLKIIAKDQNSYSMILKALINHYRYKKTYLSLTILTNKFWKKILKENTFIPYEKREKYYFTIYPHKKVNYLTNSDKWILMGGDII